MKKFKNFLLNLSEVNKKKKRGFTLIELIAVIAILGILALILVPNIAGYTNKAKVGKAVTDAGEIARAIDAYEAENSEADQANVVVSKASTGSNLEDSLNLDVLYTADTVTSATNEFLGQGKIFGTNAPVTNLPKEFTKSNDGDTAHIANNITVEMLRNIANKTTSVVIGSNGAISKVGTKTITFN